MFCREGENTKYACSVQCEDCKKFEKETEKAKKANKDVFEKFIDSGGIDLGPQDLINKPDHYHKGGVDVYEIMQMKMTPEEYRGFCKGNVLKYLLREDQKGGVDDIKKLRFNADRLIENMEGKPYIPEHKRKQSEGVKWNGVSEN